MTNSQSLLNVLVAAHRLSDAGYDSKQGHRHADRVRPALAGNSGATACVAGRVARTSIAFCM